MDNDKQQSWPSGLSNNRIYLQHIKNESKVGKEEFSHIAEDEKKRVQQVVEKENERIMQEMRENGTIQMCPICLEEISAIQPYEKRKRGKSMLMLCCGVMHCNICAERTLQDMLGKSRNDPTAERCYSCREPYHDMTYYAKTIKPDDKRHWMLRAVADCYMDGKTHGLKKNIKKAIKLYDRAADCGNPGAKEELSKIYLSKFFDAPKSLDKARHHAEMAANQGSPRAQYVLACLLLEFKQCNKNMDESFRLLTLAAFQGCLLARIDLGAIYEKRFEVMVTTKTAVGEDWRKNLLLSLFWYGKGSEVEEKDDSRPGGCNPLGGMAFHLNLAMLLLWHPRDCSNIHPLPGYSHVPFYTWAIAKGGQHTTNISFPRSPRLMHNNAWESACANCGTKSREKEQFKACARCRAFHYCSKKCQVQHWKAGHKIDCKGHWIEEFFPNIRNAQK